MTIRIAHILASRVFQGLMIALGILVILFLLADYVVMPLYTRQGIAEPVPAVVGLSVDEADSLLTQAGFTMVVEPAKVAPRAEPGSVLEQRPLPKSKSKPGRKVHITPAKEAGTNAVPYLVGLEIRDAQVRARNIGLLCGPTEVSYQFSRMTPKGLVLEQIPIEGEEVMPGTEMRLVVSLGPEPESLRVPSLTEKSLHDARLAIIEAGLELGRVTRKATDVYTAGTVIAQSLRTGEAVSRGTKVDVVVAVPIPTLDSLDSRSKDDSYD